MVLPFDNQSGDASLDWVGSAEPSIVVAQLTGLARVLPLRLPTTGDAYASHATVFVHGTFTAHEGALEFVIPIEDVVTHKMVRVIHVAGTPLDCAARIAKALDSAARPFTTENAQAVSDWGHGNYEAAVALDPLFGQAWLAWADSLAASRDGARAEDVARQALSHPIRTGIESGQLSLLVATLRNDPALRRETLKQLTKLMPADPRILKLGAESEMLARDFPSAANLYRTLLRIDPDPGTLNGLGYAEAAAGNVDAAKSALEQYGREPGQQANSLDSLGEAYFMNGKFADAEKYFLGAHERDSKLLGGGDLLKAAYARWLGGDLAGADTLDQRYLQFRAAMHDPAVVWRQATWLYSTGRTGLAIEKLKSVPIAGLAERQEAVWQAAAQQHPDVGVLKAAFDRTAPPGDGEVKTAYAAALAAAGEKDAARPLLTLWPLPQPGDSLSASTVFPQFLALRKQLDMK